MVDVPESNRRPAKQCSLLYPTELPSSRNNLARYSAYATAAPRAPDGTQAHAAGHRSMEAPHCRLSPTGNSCAHAFPVAARAEHRGAALARLVAESSAAGHVHGPRCPDVRGRMLRMSEKSVSETVRAAKDRARVRRTLFADAERKTPPDGYPRAFACLGDRGGRSP
jgi:hypothetical protein